MFAAIAPRYDSANRLLTAGVDEAWRRRAVRELRGAGGRDRPRPVLRHRRSRVPPRAVGPVAARRRRRLLRADARGARRRTPRERGGERVRFELGDAMALPFAGRELSTARRWVSRCATSSTSPPTLRETRRVLRPGARFVNLDVSRPRRTAFVRALFDLYFYRVVPLLGGLVGRLEERLPLPAALADELSGRRSARRRFLRGGFRAGALRCGSAAARSRCTWVPRDRARPERCRRDLHGAGRGLLRALVRHRQPADHRGRATDARRRRKRLRPRLTLLAAAAAGADRARSPPARGVHGTDPRRDADPRRRRRPRRNAARRQRDGGRLRQPRSACSPAIICSRGSSRT